MGIALKTIILIDLGSDGAYGHRTLGIERFGAKKWYCGWVVVINEEGKVTKNRRSYILFIVRKFYVSRALSANESRSRVPSISKARLASYPHYHSTASGFAMNSDNNVNAGLSSDASTVLDIVMKPSRKKRKSEVTSDAPNRGAHQKTRAKGKLKAGQLEGLMSVPMDVLFEVFYCILRLRLNDSCRS